MEADEDLGEDYTTQYRMYDAGLGRWFSPDPLVYDDETPYSFCMNNPVNYTDPLGLKPKKNASGTKQTRTTMGSGGLKINGAGSKAGRGNTLKDIGKAVVDGGEKALKVGAKVGQVSGATKNLTKGKESNNRDKLSESEALKQRAKEIADKETAEQDNNYNFFYKDKDDALRFGAEYVNDGGASTTSNVISINSHGSDVHVSTPMGPYKPKDLHNYLYANNKLYKINFDYKIETVIIINACKTGNSFAKDFSKLNPYVKVKAPTKSVSGWFNFIDSGGEWVVFKNGNLLNED